MSLKKDNMESGILDQEMRSTERVRAYLESELSRLKTRDGGRLLPIRKISKKLGVATATVQGVFREYSRKGKIETCVGNGTFVVGSSNIEKPKLLRIGVNLAPVNRIREGSWGQLVADGVFKAAARSVPSMMIVNMTEFIEVSTENLHRIKEECQYVDGVILFPFGKSYASYLEIEKSGKPVVYLNAPRVSAVSDFVSFDYYGVSYCLGSVWKNTGRKKGLMLVDDVESVSSRQRIHGFMDGYDPYMESGRQFDIVKANSTSEIDGYHKIKFYLEQNGIPDAIYCMGDGLALGCLDALLEFKVKVPEQVSVVGGSGLDLKDSTWMNMTRMKMNFELAGKMLVEMISKKILHRGVDCCGHIIKNQYMGGSSTRKEENVLLELKENLI